MNAAPTAAPTAAMLMIGNEVLSGRTVDQNLNFLAKALSSAGLDLQECRVIQDDVPVIVQNLQALSRQYDHVFSTGGIGPTHDDMTADAVAIAFDRPLVVDAAALTRLVDYYQGVEQVTPARKRMARIPLGATLIDNPVSGAPGFSVGNVHVMAGSPKIFQAMLNGLLPRLAPDAQPYRSVTIQCPSGESRIADVMTAAQANYPDLQVGSYPTIKNDRPHTAVVVRGRDDARIDACVAGLFAEIVALVPQSTLGDGL